MQLPAKQHWAGGMGEKGSHCPMLLSEIVALWLKSSTVIRLFILKMVSFTFRKRLKEKVTGFLKFPPNSREDVCFFAIR